MVDAEAPVVVVVRVVVAVAGVVVAERTLARRPGLPLETPTAARP